MPASNSLVSAKVPTRMLKAVCLGQAGSAAFSSCLLSHQKGEAGWEVFCRLEGTPPQSACHWNSHAFPHSHLAPPPIGNTAWAQEVCLSLPKLTQAPARLHGILLSGRYSAMPTARK